MKAPPCLQLCGLGLPLLAWGPHAQLRCSSAQPHGLALPCAATHGTAGVFPKQLVHWPCAQRGVLCQLCLLLWETRSHEHLSVCRRHPKAAVLEGERAHQWFSLSLQTPAVSLCGLWWHEAGPGQDGEEMPP